MENTEITDLDDYLYEIRVRRVEYAKHYPKDFWGVVGEPWFRDIGPKKAREYGFEAFEFLGPRAHIVDICGCHFRWKKLTMDGVDPTAPSMLNALRDGFGYGVIVSVMTGIMPDFEEMRVGPINPHNLATSLARTYWWADKEIDEEAVTIANQIPYNEFYHDGEYPYV